MRALRNTFYSRLRTASRRPRATETLDDVAVAESRVTSQPDRAAEVREIFEVIAELPEDFRMAIVAVDVLGLSYREAADVLGAREATITTRLYRARQRVAGSLSDEPGSVPTREGSGPDRSLTR
jgi:RNA polymerase sigma-70 factor (ECF subfamily)